MAGRRRNKKKIKIKGGNKGEGGGNGDNSRRGMRETGVKMARESSACRNFRDNCY